MKCLLLDLVNGGRSGAGVHKIVLHLDHCCPLPDRDKQAVGHRRCHAQHILLLPSRPSQRGLHHREVQNPSGVFTTVLSNSVFLNRIIFSSQDLYRPALAPKTLRVINAWTMLWDLIYICILAYGGNLHGMYYQFSTLPVPSQYPALMMQIYNNLWYVLPSPIPTLAANADLAPPAPETSTASPLLLLYNSMRQHAVDAPPPYPAPLPNRKGIFLADDKDVVPPIKAPPVVFCRLW